ncbi:MAG: UDP-N-acetylglucosamine 1-carboxyvinyltransferase [Omnitrophica bacterium RIFCSPLOWO2_02_FULL_45_16]|nr:MAG: UDP-N-acetylglucosamine 1-carboxyvinyltransferase [Omnitrophica bacterium RIFCSPHIGHO2_02_FULL_46_20]OGW93467.1 MAG: UDP-N-acetylglucosamine 1-carboxyvinyltransferase [Omnitrophica bacterium RIFCSPLOWO2_12_FULL_45_13]OGW95022.1 MAG: UDP-N-acetylglucosamine 1-carboxyvinyltransferase [Omnitrophica bacterium RIFCSPLOWO2_01_FULL_45_24]OGW99947.1 MAG: UDP-N-acetylglucosamine 1-carboxyvinyltransferase [Omnitrophica bacterium RIFCSPLOWO2_02_FULL_45_16]
MDKLVIEGGRRLDGSVTISGAKNACLPILAATLLSDDKSVIRNIPALRDMSTMLKILKNFGVRVQQYGDVVKVEPKGYSKYVAPYELVSTMRASICVLGPLLSKQKKAEVSFPGGCVIGPRPIDIHLKGLTALGAKLKIEKGYIIARAKFLKGTHIYLGGHFGSSVLATDNVMMAATLAKGVTIIENAACEPEVVDLAAFLVKMGAKIKGHGTPRIIIEGVKKLHGAEHSVIPDRIETGTYMLAAAITKGDIMIKNAKLEHLIALADKLTESGLSIKKVPNGIRVKYIKKLKPTDVTTLPFPGFPTDMQAQFMSLMTVTNGISVITEKIYPERFIHISELNRMGANILLEGPCAIIKGVKNLSGAPVMASDLRASAALVLAGLVAEGRTDVHRIYHLDRGYENLEEKLLKLGAKVWREKEK